MGLFNQSWPRQAASPMGSRARPSLMSGWKGGMGPGDEPAMAEPASSSMAMAVRPVVASGMAPQVLPTDYRSPQGLLSKFLGPQQMQSPTIGTPEQFAGDHAPDILGRRKFGFGRGGITGPTVSFRGNA